MNLYAENTNHLWYTSSFSESEDLIDHMHFETLDSTQLQARLIADQIIKNSYGYDLKRWIVITSDEQLNGIGQHGKTWFSPPSANNIYATYIINFPMWNEKKLFHITQTVSVAIAETLEHFCFTPSIKWINDILLGNKKVCGILCENYISHEQERILLIGIGMNVNLEYILETLSSSITSLKLHSYKHWDSMEILNVMHLKLRENLYALCNKGFASIIPKLRQRIAHIGACITVEGIELYPVSRQICKLSRDFSKSISCINQTISKPLVCQRYTGFFEGLNMNGEMILRTPNKTIVFKDCKIIQIY